MSQQKRVKETHPRTIVKTITWRIIATLTTVSLVYIFTGHIGTSLSIGVLEVISKMLFYYFHERGWDQVGWGRKINPLADLPITKEIKSEDMEKIKQQLRDLGYLD